VNKLERLIRARIAARGPIPFDQFMDLALYHPALGYYRRARDPFGIGGDYYTASQLQPVFGRLIAQQIDAWYERLGRPRDFTVAELGAGRGETAHEIRSRLPHVRCLEIEKGGALPEHLTGVIFSNEFFDALPVRVVRHGGGGITECFVAAAGDRLAWVEGEPSSARLAEYVRRFAPSPAPGQILEIHLAALDWLERIARSLDRGYVLTVDYGYTSREIAEGGRFQQGSLMSYRRHTAQEDVLADPGGRDITAHVNFTALIEHGKSLGLHPRPLQTLARFLLSIGQADQFQSALAAAGGREAERNRMLLKTLLFGMGESFQVLVQEKG
jgi:SAM-dependent MidA family methyltransferase